VGDNMRDMRLELRCRNNVLWHAIFDTCSSVAEWCRDNGFAQGEVGAYLNLSKCPYSKNSNRKGNLTQNARRMCEATGLSQEELFPVDLYSESFPKTAVAEVDSSKFMALSAAREVLALEPSPEDVAIKAELIGHMSDVIDTLTPRESRIIRALYGLAGQDKKTMEDISVEDGVSRTRIQQVAAKALRKMRHPSRSRRLYPVLDVYDAESSRRV